MKIGRIYCTCRVLELVVFQKARSEVADQVLLQSQHFYTLKKDTVRYLVAKDEKTTVPVPTALNRFPLTYGTGTPPYGTGNYRYLPDGRYLPYLRYRTYVLTE